MAAGWNKGILATEARKEKVSDALRGRKLSEKNKENIGKANKGKVRIRNR